MPDKTVRLHSDEVDCFFGLYASLQELIRDAATMEKRLGMLQDGPERMTAARDTLSQLIDDLTQTVPAEKLAALRRNMRQMQFRVYLVPPVNIPETETLTAVKDLNALIRSAHGYRCVGCDENCGKCELGQALDRVMVQTRKPGESWSWININREYDEEDVFL